MSLQKRIEKDLQGAVTIDVGSLYWVSLCNAFLLRESEHTHYFSTDDVFAYSNFNTDFGPLNLGCVHQYCRMVCEKLLQYPQKRVIHWCTTTNEKRNNAAFLMCAYQIVCLRRSAKDAYAPFRKIIPPLVPYRDAGYGKPDFDCLLIQCLKGLERAIELGWYVHETFDFSAYTKYSRMDFGDLSWLVPGKLLAFPGPTTSGQDPYGYPTYTPDDYIEEFHEAGVTLVVRLNTPQYNRNEFIENGIDHVDLYVRDGSVPSLSTIYSFLDLCDNTKGPIAVHCKAGLGRTGTLIGCYAIKNYKFPASWWIGWNRICRPGSILGPQQQFLVNLQDQLQLLGPSIESLNYVQGEITEPSAEPDETALERSARRHQSLKLQMTSYYERQFNLYGRSIERPQSLRGGTATQNFQQSIESRNLAQNAGARVPPKYAPRTMEPFVGKPDLVNLRKMVPRLTPPTIPGTIELKYPQRIEPRPKPRVVELRLQSPNHQSHEFLRNLNSRRAALEATSSHSTNSTSENEGKSM
eukprot:Platyproteum_vivax@DN12068_c0_g1_i1.p1